MLPLFTDFPLSPLLESFRMVRSSSDSLVRSEQFFSSFSDYRIPFESFLSSFSVCFVYFEWLSSFSDSLVLFERFARNSHILQSQSVPVANSPVPFKLEKDPKRQSAGRENTDRARPPGRKKARNRRKRKRSLGREGVRDLRGRGNLFRGSHDQKSHPERPAARLPKPPAPQNPKAPIETQVSSGWES